MNKRAILIAAFLLLPLSAEAATVDVRATGIVASGFDFSGVFSDAGGDLSGQAFLADFLFDTSLGEIVNVPGSLESTIGGPFLATSDPSLGAALTINGHTVPLSGNSLGRLSYFPLGSQIAVFASDSSSAPFDASFVGVNLDTSQAPSSLDASFAATGTPDPDLNQFQIAQGNASASGVLSPTQITASLVSAAPEPCTWLLMMAGVGWLGLALRRRLMPLPSPSR